jgi:DNA mismatch repair protein MutS
MAETWDNLADVHELIEKTILPDAPVSIRDGGIIREGHDAALDELRTIGRDGKHWIARMEARERERTGIESLKIRFNQVFGYYIEITRANLAKVPADYSRKQTLANAERFITPELKELEDKVTGAGLKQKALEQELFERIRAQLARETARIQAMGTAIAALDVLASLAETAALNGYVRPAVDEGGEIRISDGRHPVVERLDLPQGFIPNDTLLDPDANRLLILTGPNMAGKSTYLRQVALIVLMAQTGSFVPARSARIGLVDRIFTRVGASDNLAAGQSTFMVEMTETAQILNSATARSLILLDEIGRGTSTYDGLSIAWAVAEYIQDRSHVGARTMFATHYHEMTELANRHEGVKNYTVAVKEQNEDVLFLRKIVEGGADRSYGIHVARLAGLPAPVIDRAREVLAQLELSSTQQAQPGPQSSVLSTASSDPTLPAPHPIIEEVRQIDLFSMTPLEAMNRLAEMQRRLDKQDKK